MSNEKQRYQNPAARHIDADDNIARRAREMPWRVVGGRILLYMMKGEHRTHKVEGSEKELIIPSVAGHLGEEKERTFGLVVAFGPGEITPAGGYISPEHDYGMYIGAVVMIDPNAGHIIRDDDAEYRSITVWDIVAVLDPSFGKQTYQRLRTRAASALSKYEEDRDEVGFQSDKVPAMPFGRKSDGGVEEAIEVARERRGVATKTSFLVSKKKET